MSDDIEKRREEIERRLRELREERAGKATTVDETSTLELSSSGYVLRVGDSVKIRNEPSALELAEKGLVNRDPLKSIYLGERGTVRRILVSFEGRGPAAEVFFVDGVSKVFFMSCIDTGAKSANAIQGVTAATKAVSTSINATETAALSSPIEVPSSLQIANPTWSSLRRPGAKLGPSRTTSDEALPVSPVAPTTSTSSTGASQGHEFDVDTPPPPAPASSVNYHREPDVVEPVERAAHVDPGANNVVSVPTYHLGTNTPRGIVTDDDDDDLRVPLRDEDLRTSSEIREEGAAVSSTPGQHVFPNGGGSSSKIPPCSPDYTPKYPLGDPNSRIPRASRPVPSTAVKHCLIVGVDSQNKVMQNNTSLKSMSRPIAFRSHQTTMDAILAACTKELDWGRVGKRVDRLFLADGSELLWPDAIPPGVLLVATSGEPYRPLSVSTRVPISKVAPVRPVSPVVQRRPVLSLNTPPQKPIAVKVFINGEYGDTRSDPIPYKTVTIRPTFKTLASVRTLLARELQWASIGRQVELLYSAQGEEIQTLETIRDGDSIVASSGDRFIVPRSTTVLHQEVVARAIKNNATTDTVATARPKSPIARPKSPSRMPTEATSAGVSVAQARAARLLAEMRSLERQQFR